MTAERILVVRLAGIGDVVMASTVLPKIREQWPSAVVHWVCGNTAAPLVEQFDGVDRVISVNETRLFRGGIAGQLGEIISLWTRILGGGYTRVLLLHVDSRYRVLVTPLLRAKISVLSRRDAHGRMNPVPGRYFGDEYARLVDSSESLGPLVGHAPLVSLRSPLEVPHHSGRVRVALIPGGTKNVLRESALKRWPVAGYVEVARALLAEGCEVLLAGDAADAWVRPSFAGLDVSDRIGATTLPEIVSLFAGCDLVISHDTGPMHLARLARAPVLALFGPTIPAHFLPEDDRTTVLWGGEALSCRPCYDGREFAKCGDNRCMSSISADVVIRTARTMLAARAAAIPLPPTTRTPTENAPR
ncbi:MAG: glycosyltransferase family 9 protein [Gemmatimonadaceae bacterium]